MSKGTTGWMVVGAAAFGAAVVAFVYAARDAWTVDPGPALEDAIVAAVGSGAGPTADPAGAPPVGPDDPAGEAASERPGPTRSVEGAPGSGGPRIDREVATFGPDARSPGGATGPVASPPGEERTPGAGSGERLRTLVERFAGDAAGGGNVAPLEDFESRLAEVMSEARFGDGGTPPSTLGSGWEARALEGRLGDAVRSDPFLPDRGTGPDYLFPWERRRPAPVEDEEEEEEREDPDFRVVGTALIGEGGVALVQTDDGETRLVSIGESVDGFRLGGLTADAAVFSGGGWTGLTVPVTRPSEDIEVERRNGRTTINFRGLDISARQLRELQEAIRRRSSQNRRDRRRGGGGSEGSPVSTPFWSFDFVPSGWPAGGRDR